MIELLIELVFGVAVMFAVFGSVGIALGLGATAAAAIAGTIAEKLWRRCR